MVKQAIQDCRGDHGISKNTPQSSPASPDCRRPWHSGMIGHHPARMTDNDATGQNHDLNALSDQGPGYGVAVRIGVDRVVRLNLAHQVTQLSERRPARKRTKRSGLNGKSIPAGATTDSAFPSIFIA